MLRACYKHRRLAVSSISLLFQTLHRDNDIVVFRELADL